MKNAILIASFLGMIFAACGSDGEDSLDYNGLCTTSCEVDEACDLLDNLSIDQCISACEATAMNHLAGFFEAFVACKAEKSCQELSEGGENSNVCYDDNIAECTTDTSDYLDAACTTKLECDGVDGPTTAQMDKCKETMHGDGNILRCFEDSKLADAESCIENASSCSPDPVKDCVESILGITLGKDNNDSGGGGQGQ